MLVFHKIYLHILIKYGRRICLKLEKNCANPTKSSTARLRKILRTNANTEFGKKHGFSRISTVEEYQKKIPISQYSDYEPYLQRMMSGEKNILFKGLPSDYVETSGSVGRSKIIPFSKYYSRKVLETGTPFTGIYLANQQKKLCPTAVKTMAIGAATDVKKTVSGQPISDLVAVYAMQSKPLLPFVLTTPLESMFSPDAHDRIYVHLLFGLAKADELCVFVASYLIEITDLIRCLLKNKDSIIHDLEVACISDCIAMPSKLRHALNQKLTPQPKMAKRVRNVLETGETEGILHKLWPNLRVLYAFGGEGDLLQQTKLAVKYAGEHVKFMSYSHGASEGIMGKPLGLNDIKYIPTTDNVFMEFIDMIDEDNKMPPVYTLEQLQVGHEYEMLITNTSGFYRYRLNDVIRVVEKREKMPVYKFAYRKNSLLNLCGEKTSIDHIAHAITQCQNKTGVTIADYAFIAVTKEQGNHYSFYIECKEEGEDLSEFAAVLQTELEAANPDFAFACSGGSIEATRVVQVRRETFHDYRMEKRKLSAGGGNSVKAIKVISNSEMQDFMDKNMIATSEQVIKKDEKK